MKKIFFLITALICSVNLYSQCPVVTCPSSALLTCPAILTVAATSNYTNNISARWIGPGNIPLTSILTGNSSTLIIGAPGTYTVEFKDNSSNCVTSQTLNVTNSANPSFSLVASSYTQTCTNSILTFAITNVNTNPFPGGPTTYAFCACAPSATYATSTVSVYTTNVCGNHIMRVRDNTNNCVSAYYFVVSCPTLVATPITINGTNSVCIGSSTDLSVSGANTYTWSNASNSPSINVTPTTTTNYSVSGTNSVGCVTSSNVAVTVNTTCAQVWPGDANSDGIVDNTDVFELGLWNLNNGAARSFTSNAYTSQFANNWTGTVSTGKNKNHADCNGDGVINSADTLAIYNNFLQSHAFKTANIFASNPDITIVPTQTLVGPNSISSADIFLGDIANPITQIYGVAFDVLFDSTYVQNNSVYVSYTPSFLNASNQNINFTKSIYNNQKAYTASVRIDGSNVSGNGKIATLYFTTKSGYPNNSFLNLSVVNAKKISNAGITNSLTTGTTLVLLSNINGVHENSNIQNLVTIFPNPAKEILYINNQLKEIILVEMIDILGKVVFSKTVTSQEKIDLKGITTGVYFINVKSSEESFKKKIVVE